MKIFRSAISNIFYIGKLGIYCWGEEGRPAEDGLRRSLGRQRARVVKGNGLKSRQRKLTRVRISSLSGFVVF